MIPLSTKVWVVRVLVFAGMVLLCASADSGIPALAFALAWGPNGLFLAAFQRGALHLPRSLESVHPIEPLIYRWIGVGLVKRLVATRMWPMLLGFEASPKPINRRELLDRTELATKGSEICHGLTLILAFFVAIFCLTVGQTSAAVWILVFNVALNGYPVMVQRANRWRVHQIRANHS
jgi:hypothetical protein